MAIDAIHPDAVPPGELDALVAEIAQRLGRPIILIAFSGLKPGSKGDVPIGSQVGSYLPAALKPQLVALAAENLHQFFTLSRTTPTRKVPPPHRQ